MTIRVLVPDMPSPIEMFPFLVKMHQGRSYCNGGPLVTELGRQVALHHRGGHALPVSNGTVALELTLHALGLARRSRVLVPSLTFVGSARAIVNAGLKPLVCDVHARTCQLTTSIAEEALAKEEFEAVMPVCAYGRPVDGFAWREFAERHKIPVVIDAAACLLTQHVPVHPLLAACFSLHGTKFVGAGEGGVALINDDAWAARVLALSTFGRGGTNGKLSEFHAMAALASLKPERLSVKRKDISTVFGHYQRYAPVHLRLPHGIADPTLLPVLFPPGDHAERAADVLNAAGVETKRWYAPFLHERPEFADDCLAPLPNVIELSERMLGLPFHTRLSEEDVSFICGLL